MEAELMTDCSFHPTARFLAGPRSDMRLSWRSVTCIVLYGASMLLIHLGGARVLTYHEVLFAQPAKEMLESGNWVLPTIAGIPSTHKPPGTHWSIAASMVLFDSQSEWIVRLPSVVAAVLLALLVAGIAARWFGERVGLLSGLVQLTMLYTLQWARLAECDIFLWVAITAAMGAFALANVDSPSGRRPERWIVLAFYAAAGVSFLVKGLTGPVFIFSGCVLFFLVNQDLRGLRFFWSPTGLVLFGSCVFVWPIAAYVAYPAILDDQIMHHFDRFRGEMGGQKAPLFYVYNLPLLLVPWTPLVILAVVRGLRQGQYANGFWRLVICWFVPGMLILALSQFKSKHYAAPLLPPFSIVAALGLLDFLRRRYRAPKSQLTWLVMAWLLCCGAAAVAVYIASPRGTGGILIILAGITLAAMGMLYFEYRRQQNAHLAVIFATIWLVAVGIQLLVMPHHDSYRGQTEMAARLNRTLPDGQPLYVVELPENQIVYYLTTPVVRIDAGAEFFARFAQLEPDFLYLLVPERFTTSLAPWGGVEVLDRCERMPKAYGPGDRLTFVRLNRASSVQAARDADATRR